MMTMDLTVKESELKIVYGPDYLGEDVSELSLASVKYMYTDLTDIRKYYIRLGFHLNEFDVNKGYLDFGYSTLEEFCNVNLGLDKSAVSRCINVYREFNAGGDRRFIRGIENRGSSFELSDKWKDYSYTQLCEMLPLSPEDRMKILPSMSCREIREYKKTLKDRKNKSLNGAVASTQPKRFNYDECFKKSGIVQQNYIKSCDYDQKEGMPAVYLYDCHGKRIMFGHCGFVLERVNNSNENRIVIRMTGYCYDPVELKEN